MVGFIFIENDDVVEVVEVLLSGQMSILMMINLMGIYEFVDLLMGYDYMVMLFRNDEYCNGVLIFDLIIIQQYLLGIVLLGSLYKMIVVDVNRINFIMILDMIQI